MPPCRRHTNKFAEACAFRARAFADRRRAERLVEDFRRAIAAVRLQRAVRRLLVARTLQRAEIAEQGCLQQEESDSLAARRVAWQWRRLALRLRKRAGGAKASASAAKRGLQIRGDVRAADKAALGRRERRVPREAGQEKREASAVRLQAAGRRLVARRKYLELVDDRDWAAELHHMSDDAAKAEEPAWLREAEELLAKETDVRAEAGSPRSDEGKRFAARAGECSPVLLSLPSTPPPIPVPIPPSPPPLPPPPVTEGRHEGMSWRSGGRQRKLFRDLRSERRAEVEATLEGALAAACDESRAYAESIRSAAELQERLLYEEREEARQLALAMEQSVAYSGALDEEQQAAFFAVCDQAGISPCDIQWPVQVPRVSDSARELKFSRKCRARRIVFDGREERSQKKLDAIRAARSMAEVVMAERFGLEVKRAEYGEQSAQE